MNHEIILTGQSLTDGCVYAPILRVGSKTKKEHTAASVPNGEGSVRAVQAEAEARYSMLAEQAEQDAPGSPRAELLRLYAMIAADAELTALAETSVSMGKTVSAAFRDAAEILSRQIAALNDPHLASRAEDIRMIGARLSAICDGEEDIGDTLAGRLKTPSVLVFDEPSPEQIAVLSQPLAAGILICSPCGMTSHAAILAKALGVPTIAGIGPLPENITDGTPVIVDAGQSCAVFHPANSRILEIGKAQEQAASDRARALMVRGLPDCTPDGQHLAVYANLASPEEIASALAEDARGIGLYRSEFLYLGRETPPDEEEQFDAFRQVLTAMPEKPVIVRTADIGADKTVSYLDLPKEQNPALGLRGVRLFFARPSLAVTQLRALLRAARYGNLSVMFPMITGGEDFARCMALVQDAEAGLQKDGISHRRPTFGAMLETPAACLSVEELYRAGARFFSVGTNDLTQYTLAADREGVGTGEPYTARHPAVKALIRMAAETAGRLHCPVGICGEAAADPEMLPFFLTCRIHELSVPPARVLSTRL
ncbi:MAG: PEP-utilizing enzyme, partial [Clostridia bacterium]|nr:PEP-utilizing enzyme [Clostridia bacterium]